MSKFTEHELVTLTELSVQRYQGVISTYLYDYDDFRDYHVAALGFTKPEMDNLLKAVNVYFCEFVGMVREHYVLHGVSPMHAARGEFRHKLEMLVSSKESKEV